FFVFCFLSAAGIASAQYSIEDQQKALDVDGQNLQKFGTQNFAGGFVNPLIISLTGCSTCKNPQLKTGAIPATGSMIAYLYDSPPASGVYFAGDLLKRFNPVQPAYAQTGTGFNGLQPLLRIWKAFRDFAYAFFAIAFIGIGLAIMLRMKIDPRTVLTIQSAIPRIVIALLLVTFSYAIAGFMIDLMYILISLAILVFGRAGADVPTFQAQYLTGGFSTLWQGLWGIVGGGRLALSSVGLIFGGILTSLVVPPLGGVLTTFGIGLGVLTLILSAIILFLIFRLFLDLIKAYISIIIAVIVGPLQIALGVIPGMPGFGSWFKGLLTNILIFPAVAFVLMLGQTLTGLGLTAGLWRPPLLAGGSAFDSFLPIMIGLGLLLVIHQVPDAVKTMMAGKAPIFSPGEAIGTTLITSGGAGALEQQARSPRNPVRGALFGAGASVVRGMSGGRR
ncbi:MAG: hypothetical protein AAB599_03015, partial [Patescibacteria group bacterium]